MGGLQGPSEQCACHGSVRLRTFRCMYEPDGKQGAVLITVLLHQFRACPIVDLLLMYGLHLQEIRRKGIGQDLHAGNADQHRHRDRV